MGGRHPALARLDVLVGRWDIRPHVEALQGKAWMEVAWDDGGLFLRQDSDAEISADAPRQWRENAPFPTSVVIGLDDATGEFTYLYADARGVHRVYRMTFDGEVWTIWRDAPGFSQRFTGRLSEDGDTIEARWEICKDGVNWEVDFGITYTRVH